MAETQTPNFKWTKPDIGGDASTWGNVLNTTFDAIDSVAWASQQASAPIGTIIMFAGTTPPAHWMWCNGAVYLDADVPALAPVLNHAFPGSDASHTAVPNLNGRVPVGYDGGGYYMGYMAGEYNHALSWGELAAHYHNVWQDAHSHYSWQDLHTHYDTGHGHGVTASQDAHTHTVTFPIQSSGAGFGSFAPPSPAVWQGGTTETTSGASQNNVYVSIAAGYASLTNAQPANHVDTQQPAVHMDSQGSGTPHNNMQPYTVVGFIIRYQ